MSATTTQKRDQRFDPEKLGKMQEPLTVRVEKIRGGAARIPIDLPVREPDLAPGLGWDRDSVRRIENWLMTECPGGGGGVYHVLVVDSIGDRMEWQFLADPRLYPEIPPLQTYTLGTPAIPPNGNNLKQPQGPTYTMAQNPYWPFPSFPPAPTAQPAQPAAPPAPQPMTVLPTNWPWPAPPASPPAATPISRRDDDEKLRRLEEQLRVAEERAREADRARAEQAYKAELDKIQQNHQVQLAQAQAAAKEQLDAMREEMRRVAESMAKPAVSPEIERERIEHQREVERQRAEREREKAEIERERERERIEREKAERERDRELERERAEREKLEREREREQTNLRFEKIAEMIAKVAETKAQVPAGPDPVLEELRRNNERLAEEMRREREKVEAERREAERRETERREREQLREEMRAREQVLRDQLTQLSQNQNRGPDPFITMMQESNRQQMESIKEVIRNQQSATDKLAAFMMSPRDILAIANDKSNGIDQITKNVVGVFNDMFQTQKQLVEMAAQMSGGGESPAMRIVEQIAGKAGDLADRYVRLKTAEATGAAKVAEAQAQAQAQALAAQQARIAELAQREAAAAAAAAAAGLNGARSGGVMVTPPPVVVPQGRPSPQGTTVRPNGSGAGEGALPAATTPSEPASYNNPPPTPPTPVDAFVPNVVADVGGAKVIPLRRLGHTDAEWFGPAIGYVEQLREGVDELIHALSLTPPRTVNDEGQQIGLHPADVVDHLLRAVNYAEAQGERILIIEKLFKERRYADLMDIVLPDAPQVFRDDCVNLLNQVTKSNGASNGASSGSQVEA